MFDVPSGRAVPCATASRRLRNQLLSVDCPGRQYPLGTEERRVERVAQNPLLLLPVPELARDDSDDDDDDDDDSQDDEKDDDQHGGVVALAVIIYATGGMFWKRHAMTVTITNKNNDCRVSS